MLKEALNREAQPSCKSPASEGSVRRSCALSGLDRRFLRNLLLSCALLLPAVPHAAQPAAKTGIAKQSPKPSAAAKRNAKKPAGAKAVVAPRGNAAARSAATAAQAASPAQAATPDPRMEFLQQFADADEDGNGLLSRQEAERNLPAVAGKFDIADASSDGWLTPEELRSFLQGGRSSESRG